MPSITSLFTVLSVAAVALAKTDLSGCTSSQTVAFGGASMIWYVPGTGEICAPLDCGGGRAPPKTTVPGCAAYSGTETYSPSYLSNWGSATATATSTASSRASSVWGSTTASSVKSIETSKTTAASLSTPAAPVVTSSAALSSASLSYQSYGTAATLSTFANGTLSATATPSATPSGALSNDGVAQSGSHMLVMAGAAIAGFALW